MKRATPVLLFLGSNCAGVYALLSIRKLALLVLAGTNTLNPDLPDNWVLHHKEYWTQGLFGLLVAVVLTIAFLITARGRWRFAVGLPLAICAFVALGLVVQRP